jgi:hypothetical protein
MRGLRRWEIDVSALLIGAMEATGFAWGGQRVTRERQGRPPPLSERTQIVCDCLTNAH